MRPTRYLPKGRSAGFGRFRAPKRGRAIDFGYGGLCFRPGEGRIAGRDDEGSECVITGKIGLMPKISISYRRADSEAMTGRIFDRLISHYGKDAIFRDIDDIPPGIDFRVHINETLRKTHILLAIVGPGWLGASSGGLERIQEESDPVRVEVETALRRRTPLIPVLIGNTRMPSSDELPPSLKDFSFRNAVRVDTGQDFDYHMDRLIRSMDGMLSQTSKSPSSGESRTPGPRPETGSRQAAAAVVEGTGKRETGSRGAAPSDQASSKERPSFVLTLPRVTMPRVAPGVLWPEDRQGQIIRLGFAGVAAIVLALIFGVVLRGSSGEQHLLTLTGHTGTVSTVAFSPDSRLIASGSYDKSVKIWEAGTGLLRQTMSGESDAVYAIAFEPNGKRIISGGKDGVIAVRDIESGQRMVRPLRPEVTYGWDTLPAVLALAIAPDGVRLAAGNADSTIRIWNDNTGALLRILSGHSDAVTSVAYMPDGKVIVSGSADGMVRTWDAETGQSLRVLKGHAGPIYAVAISPDGRLIAAGGSGDAVGIWNAGNFQQQPSLATQLSAVNALAFSRDGRRLAVGGSDAGIQIWDTNAGQLLQSLTGHSGSIRALAVSPDGRRLASGSEDRTVSIWSAN
jgi:WD40 repeat protein